MQIGVSDILLDYVYEAAIVPTKWPELLEDFAVRLNAAGGLLFTANANRTEWVTSPKFTETMARFVNSGWASRNIRIAKAVEKNCLGYTVADQDLFSPEELDGDPMYAFLRANGGGWFVGSTIETPGGETLIVSFERSYAQGRFEPDLIKFIEAYRPHLARAAMLSGRLGLERARAAAEAMGLIGLPTAVISRANRVMVCNDLFQSVIPSIVIDGRFRVMLKDKRADPLLEAALHAVNQNDAPLASTFSIPIAASKDTKACALHVVPIRRSARDIFSGSSCLLIMSSLALKRIPDHGLIQGLFDLTRAEAKIAQALAMGKSLSEYATETKLSIATARTQLKSVFEKTGVTRQAQLVSLLAGVTL